MVTDDVRTSVTQGIPRINAELEGVEGAARFGSKRPSVAVAVVADSTMRQPPRHTARPRPA